MTDPQHGLLCRAFGPGKIIPYELTEPPSDFEFWRNRLADRCGEVVFGLLISGDRLALTRNGEYPDGVYRVPSGGIHYGEAVIDALYREVAEELGRPFEVLRYAGVIEFRFGGPGEVLRFSSYCFLLRELPAPDGGRRQAPTDAEVEAVLTASPAELDGMLRVLHGLGEPWQDWGQYRAASGRLVASAWADLRSTRGGEVCELVDVSLPLHPAMAAYPGDPPVDSRIVTARPPDDEGPAWLVSAWQLNAHSGTHVDAPAHLFPGGRTVDLLPPRSLCGPALVVDCRRAVAAGRPVGRGDLPGPDALRGRVVLLKLGLGAGLAAGRYDPSVPVLAAEGASYLVSAEVLAVGVESLSADPAGSVPSAHLALLGAGVPLIEGLDLSRAGAGEWEIFALPLPLRGAEAAPCRAVLRRRSAGRPPAGSERSA